jgi:hypothetical protein
MVAFSVPLSSDLVPVQVTNRDVEKLSIPLLPTFNINGRISVDGNTRANVSAKINLVRTSPEVDLRVQTATAADGSFTLFGVGQGEYDVSVEPLLPGSYVRSIRYGGRDVLAGGMRVGLDPNASLEIVLSSAGAAIQGRVVNRMGDPASGARVVLVPERRYRRRADRYIVGFTDAAGSFQMSGVPPGQYLAFAFEQIEPGAYYAFAYDPLVDLRFANRGLSANVNDVQTTTLELKLIPAAETAGGL